MDHPARYPAAVDVRPGVWNGPHHGGHDKARAGALRASAGGGPTRDAAGGIYVRAGAINVEVRDRHQSRS